MEEYFVREDTSHSATRDGLTYETAWGGWSEITWGAGAANVSGGDTLYVCGAYAYAAEITVGAHGGAAEATRCVIRGDYVTEAGAITFSGTSRFTNTRAWTTIRNLTITAGGGSALSLVDTALNCEYLNNVLVGTDGTFPLISLSGSNGQDHADILVSGNDFSGTAIAAIQWLCAAAAAVSTLTRMTIRGNSFHDLTTMTNGTINLRAESDTSQSSSIVDLIIDNNTFVDITSPSGCLKVGSDFTVFGLCFGLKIRNNYIDNAGTGGMAPHSWDQSATPGFGVNEISGNTIRNMVGVTGGINLFDSSCLITNNIIEDFSSDTIDSNGVLIDIGCADCQITFNEINRCLGKAGVTNSGGAIFIMAATNIEASSNWGDGNRQGIHFSDAGAGQSAVVNNNSFTNCIEYGVFASASAGLANIEVRNNILTGTGYSVFDSTAVAWTGEDNNCFFGFSSGTSNHTLGAGSITDDPELDAQYRVPAHSPCAAAGDSAMLAYQTIDSRGRVFRDPPSMGACEVQAGDVPLWSSSMRGAMQLRNDAPVWQLRGLK